MTFQGFALAQYLAIQRYLFSHYTASLHLERRGDIPLDLPPCCTRNL